MSDSNSSSGGVSLLGLLGVLFIGLKLANIIDWSWWYVLLPLYGGLILIMGGGIIYVSVLFIIDSYKSFFKKNKS